MSLQRTESEEGRDDCSFQVYDKLMNFWRFVLSASTRLGLRRMIYP
jgi:hypothetical protein